MGAVAGEKMKESLLVMLTRNTYFFIAFALLTLVTFLFLPVPHQLLDVLLGVSWLMAMATLFRVPFVTRIKQFQNMPTIILISAVIRLVLSVVAMRAIFKEGEAGSLIALLGNWTTGDSPVPGVLSFLILWVAMFLFLLKGTERVVEVTARFTLDKMNTLMMRIENDLNRGGITADVVMRLRNDLELEIRFAGLMEGSVKFIKGDAIVGLIIMIVNFAGGTIYGVLREGGGGGLAQWQAAANQYGTLAIGEGARQSDPGLHGRIGGNCDLAVGPDRSGGGPEAAAQFCGRASRKTGTVLRYRRRLCPADVSAFSGLQHRSAVVWSVHAPCGVDNSKELRGSPGFLGGCGGRCSRQIRPAGGGTSRGPPNSGWRGNLGWGAAAEGPALASPGLRGDPWGRIREDGGRTSRCQY